MAVVFLFEMEIRFKKNISTMFDYIGGTGFGGLVAAALNVSSFVNKNKPKYSPPDIMNFFNKQCSKIFVDKFTLATVYTTLHKIHKSMAEMQGYMYDGNGL